MKEAIKYNISYFENYIKGNSEDQKLARAIYSFVDKSKYISVYPETNGHIPFSVLQDMTGVTLLFKKSNGGTRFRKERIISRTFIRIVDKNVIPEYGTTRRCSHIAILGLSPYHNTYRSPQFSNEIKKNIQSLPCCFPGCISKEKSQCDHKDGCEGPDSAYSIEDAQPLCPTHNCFKREWCNSHCQNTSLIKYRFDARIINLPRDFVMGTSIFNEAGLRCHGCLLHDCKFFLDNLISGKTPEELEQEYWDNRKKNIVPNNIIPFSNNIVYPQNDIIIPQQLSLDL